MKKFTLFMSLMLITGMIFGQVLTQQKTKDFVKAKGDPVEYGKDLTIIWEDDFSDDSLWETAYDEDNPNDGPWVIDTVGPSGSYSEGMGPIESTTADNGFAMYDSDAIGNDASGSQDSKLIYHTSIDCSAYESVAVSFESYYRKFNGNCYIEVSTDSSTWEQYQVHEGIETNSATDNPAIVTVNITDFAASESEVYFRFRYIGEWDYAWMVDDIKFFEAPDYDLHLMDARVNFFQYPHYVDPSQYPLGDYYGYSGFFGKIPQNQIQNENALIVFDGVVKNIGTIEADPTLEITVTHPDLGEVFNNTATLGTPLSTEEKDTIDITDTELNMPNALLGTYTWAFETYDDTITDENPANNTISYETEVTTNYYSHNSGNVTGSWSTENYQDGGEDGDMIGVVYPFFEPDTISDVNVFISSMTDVGTSFVVKLLTWDSEGQEWVEEMSSPVYNISDEEQTGAMFEATLPGDGFPVEVPEDFAEILVAVEYYYGGEGSSFRLGTDGSVPTSGHETWMYFMNDTQWYYYGGDHVPVIDIGKYDDNAVDVNEYDDFSVYPNPTTGIVSIDNVQGATIEVYNMIGKRVRIIQNADFNNQIDLSGMSEGTYLVRITSDKGVGVRKINLIK
ncbi:MAG: T9SS type A sorting domain-containing protein [Bacteroidales bacterium]